MRNIQEYTEDEVKDAILAQHKKHLNFDAKTHQFEVVLDIEKDSTARVITTKKVKKSNGNTNQQNEVSCEGAIEWVRSLFRKSRTIIADPSSLL